MKVIGIIPARYASTRFPGKPLAEIGGKTMIRRVYERAKLSHLLQDVIVATDDDRIFSHVEEFGGKAVMTSPNHQSGTDRCAEVVENLKEDFDVVLNIQGDEPFIAAEQIEQILQCFNDENTEIATLIKLISSAEELFNPNKPKVLLDDDDFAIYFSRRALPYIQNAEKEEWLEKFNFYKHIGMYAYRQDVLKEISKLKPSRLEKAEGLEQLRWVESGYKIKTAITEVESIAIDNPEDIDRLPLSVFEEEDGEL